MSFAAILAAARPRFPEAAEPRRLPAILALLSLVFLLEPQSSPSSAAVLTPLRLSSSTINSPYDLIRGTVAHSPEFTKVPWFPEELEFELKWGIFSMGFATLKSVQIVDFGGQPAYHIISEARTSKFADTFYKVRDLNESWIHTGDLRSLGYSKQLREGKFFRDEWVLYDYGRKTWLSKRVNKDGSFSYSDGTIPGAVQDILSSLYYIRPHPLKVGDEILLDVNTKSNWPLKIKALRKAVVNVPAGRFKCVVVQVFVREEGIFVQKGKSLKVWLTDDERHMPVLMQVEIIFGHVSAYLVKMPGQRKAPKRRRRRPWE